MLRLLHVQTALLLASGVFGLNLLLSNDDGWATAQERATFAALDNAGYSVLLSAPAQDESGTGSSTATPQPLTISCEYDTCAVGSPAEGFNASDPRLNYVNSYPVDAVKYGIQTLSPKFYGGRPDLIVTGPNIGSNAGSTVLISGTVGAATEAALEGLPAVAFSGPSGSHVSYTTLDSEPTASSTLAALVYGQLTTTFTNALVATPPPFLPTGILLNVNFPSSSQCPDADDVSFILTRINAATSSTGPDVETCGTDRLPQEANTYDLTDGCFASVSVMNSSTKADVGASTQAVVLDRLKGFLNCLPS